MRALLPVVMAWLLGAAAPDAVRAAPAVLIADLSQNRIDINTRFRGADLLVYGAIQYPGAPPKGPPPDIAVVVRGPAEPVTVRRKSRVAGIWMNTAAVRFESVPGFYAAATTRPITELTDERMAAIYEIGVENLQLSPASSAGDALIGAFEDGLIAVKRQRGLFSEEPQGVVMTRGVLYRARVQLPADVPVGDYGVEIHMIRKGRIVASANQTIRIDKSGFERWTYLAAQEHPLAYGLFAVMAALLAGGLAAAVTRRR